jgi:hypothetical protein
MTLLPFALMVAFAAAAAVVLADSGLRLWSAFAGISAEQAGLRRGSVSAGQRTARVVTRIGYARSGFSEAAAPRLAAA